MAKGMPITVRVDVSPEVIRLVERKAEEAREEMGFRCDMRGVVIVEFWSMMSGALPFGWSWEEVPVGQYAYQLQVVGFGDALIFPDLVQCAASEGYAHDELPPKAWAAEYDARPRLGEE